jgi:hypothetical protein
LEHGNNFTGKSPKKEGFSDYFVARLFLAMGDATW